MSFFSCVYQLLIGPIEIIFEYAYKAFHQILGDYGISIIFLSLAMNFLLLPLYKRADAIQEEERQQEKDMADSVAHIKKTFSGDERFMILQAYYRQNHYKPYYVLKGFLPLVLEVPFFIAAYHFLSNLAILSGTPFRPVTDLGAPDQLLHIAGKTYNALPILMTLINCISGAIYTKGFPLKDKLQLYGMALLFLVLLYDSPAGLVIYWTTNNLFSLVRNLLGRIKKGRGILAAVAAGAGLCLIAYAWTRMKGESLVYRRPAVIFGAGMAVPLLILLLRGAWKRIAPRFRRTGKKKLSSADSAGRNNKQFICSGLLLAVLTGALIPSAVIQSSPEEFVQSVHYYSPLWHILYACLLSFGLFVVWFGVFYRLFTPRGKRIFTAIVWILSGLFLIGYMAFETDLGLLSAELFYERPMLYTIKQMGINIAVLAGAAALMFLVWKKWKQITLWLSAILLIAVTGMAGWNMIRIQSAVSERGKTLQASGDHKAHFTLSRDGQNVILIMLDRSIDRFVPYIFEEYPQLQEQFAGFTYYPNALSFGAHTLFGAPPIFGGYEYTPDEMNKRSSEPLSSKHDEALKVLPVLFRDAGYEVTVCDPPYAGYYWIPDLSIFDSEEGITAYNTEFGQFSRSADDVLDHVWQRNFFCYSIMRCAPLALQSQFYNDGFYGGSQNIHTQFERSYAVLQSLPEITRIRDGEQNTFLSLTNSATHEPYLESIPDAEQLGVMNPDFSGAKSACLDPERFGPVTIGSEWVREYYTTNAAVFLHIGNWLDYLREQGVYDNTRIVIVADHGEALGQFSDLVIFPPNGGRIDLMAYNPLLLVKDFGGGSFTMDARAITNADVPAMLLKDLLPDAVNPFTGNPFREAGEGTEMLIYTSSNWEQVTGNTFEPADWYSVHDDILNPENWQRLGTR